MRADAQRNYDRLLEEARQAFVVHGTDVALEDIARHAGVGIGTLYRHFPDRYSLMNAVFLQEQDALTTGAHALLDADDPGEALVSWLRMLAVHFSAYRGLSLALMEASENRMTPCKTMLRSSGGALLLRAQQAGRVRAGIEIADLLKLTSAIVMCAEKTPDDRGTFNRLMDLAVQGVLTRGEGATGARPVATQDARTAGEAGPVRGAGSAAQPAAPPSATPGAAAAKVRQPAG